MKTVTVSGALQTPLEQFLLSQFGWRVDMSESNALAIGVLAVGAIVAFRLLLPHLRYR